MNQYRKFTNEVCMTILNLEIKDLNRLIEFKEIYALDSCGIPILSVNDIVGCKIRCIHPTSTLNLEGMSLGTLNDLAIDVEFDESVYLVYSGRDNLFFSSLACNMVNAGNCIADLNGFNRLLAERGEHSCSSHEAEHRVAAHRADSGTYTTHYHSGNEPVLRTLYRAFSGTLAHASERSFQRSGFFVALNRTLYGSGCSSGQCACYSTDHGTLGSTDKGGSHRAERCACGTTCCCGCRCYDSRNHRHRNDYSCCNGKLLPEGHIAFIVSACYGVIIAVCEEVQTVNVVPGVFQHIGRVRVDESAGFGIVVTAVQVVESGFNIVVVATVTNRVKVTNVIGSIIYYNIKLL